MSTGASTRPSTRAQYRVVGMDCADDAAELAAAVRAVPGIETVEVSVATGMLTATTANPARFADAERAAAAAGYPLQSATTPAAVNPAYRRALWIVVLLNSGYGVVEAIAGFVSDSQALKADALDFLGDGAISFIGLLALAWPLQRRARVALAQGLFLGALGLGVIGSTIYRVLVQRQPEAEVMGLFGLIALAVNVAAAVALIPHRTGDANARAIWLFSRNDALGNLAVVVAAALVAWTASPWPDLVVAFVIAALFLQSAWSIVRDARRELATGDRSATPAR
ncbi:MAG: cation transporter [Gemmatimonadetes bacterium]|nr:cation transporter [Gemmatimonadota bacterium]